MDLEDFPLEFALETLLFGSSESSSVSLEP